MPKIVTRPKGDSWPFPDATQIDASDNSTDTWPFPVPPQMDPPQPFEDFIEHIVDHNWAEFDDN